MLHWAMWHWDQGHLPYFQFGALRRIASFVENHDFKAANRATVRSATGLDFAAPPTHSPWRNYSRVLKLCLMVSEFGNHAQPTPVAHMLSKPGAVTCDEYLHFLLRAFTEPSPALTGWSPEAPVRYPLLFSLKYLLMKTAMGSAPVASMDELIGAYRKTGFRGNEDAAHFIEALKASGTYEAIGRSVADNLRRQSRESLCVISQISYLHIRSGKIAVSLDAQDALAIFTGLIPMTGPRKSDPDGEIRRLAASFEGGASGFFDYAHTIIDEVVESGFREGSKVKKTHVVIERNAGLRKDYFVANPTTICNVCSLDTAKTYPWTERVMDIHHLLPLSSGTRVKATSTTFDDLVPVCPSCHRAIHRYYDRWLTTNGRLDFKDGAEALNVYNSLRSSYTGPIYAD